MTDKDKTHSSPDPASEHERRNEGGREFGHVHQPTQAQQASKNQGLADISQTSKAVGGEQTKRSREGEKKSA